MPTTNPSPNAVHYKALGAAANAALQARDALDNPTSKEWLALHAVASVACRARSDEMKRLAKVDRQGDWRGPVEDELILKGYL